MARTSTTQHGNRGRQNRTVRVGKSHRYNSLKRSQQKTFEEVAEVAPKGKWECMEISIFQSIGIFQQLVLLLHPEKSNIDTKHGQILKESTFSKAHHFGYPC